MTIRYNLGQSSVIALVGGFPEGSLIGQDPILLPAMIVLTVLR